MSEQSGVSFRNRKIWIGAGIAAAAVRRHVFHRDVPARRNRHRRNDRTGAALPARRRIRAADVKLGNPSASQANPVTQDASASNAASNAASNSAVNAATNSANNSAVNAATNSAVNGSTNSAVNGSTNSAVNGSTNSAVNGSTNSAVNAATNSAVNGSVNAATQLGDQLAAVQCGDELCGERLRRTPR